MQRKIEKFLNFLAVEKSCSTNTIAAYRNDLSQFCGFLDKQPLPVTSADTLQAVLPSIVQQYLDFLQEQSYASSTVARKIAALKSFLSYLYQVGDIADDPTIELKPPKVEKSPPRSIGPEAIERLLAEPDKSKSPKGFRDKALLEVLYATGMRVSELVNLNIDDVDTTAGTVICGTHSKRQRIVPVQQETTLVLDRYIQKGRQALLVDEEERALFVNHRGSRLTRQGLWLIIRDYVEAVGIDEQVTPHTLRHTFAAHLLEAGAKLQELQERLGHANASTTQVYRKLSDAAAAELTIDGAPLPVHNGHPAPAEWQATVGASD